MAQKSQGSQQGARNKLSNTAKDKTTVNEYLKEFEEGEKVLIKIEPSESEGRPHQRFHGKTVEVTGKQGDSYEVKFKDGNIEKTLYIPPIHLKRTE
ncbi:50S ribosomal protein L21e [Candidatus Nanohalobium constans]|uniref:Large ribosomal subunit protein eL21 n=1 Tax=Candidatus Nanohalobium constans TaxID=2565781 RepID=A0A5Q0UGK2_9ARCH|nr:50S ribosomal protein L21e [Candidatus Nanohalobium constans]QGA80340.1 50S ribosomal protein L21e [Candidatus Nanohalobium constans]